MKWNWLGDYPRKSGWWLKDYAYLSGKGTLMLRIRKEGALHLRSLRDQGQIRTCLRLPRGAAQDEESAEPLAWLFDVVPKCRADRQRRTGRP
jgi:hypothetical protein